MKVITNNLAINLSKDYLYIINLRVCNSSTFICICNKDIEAVTNIVTSIKDEIYQDVLNRVNQAITESTIVDINPLDLINLMYFTKLKKY